MLEAWQRNKTYEDNTRANRQWTEDHPCELHKEREDASRKSIH